jgi:hypothetical protein
MKKELFDTEVLSSLDKMDLNTAKKTALEMVKVMPRKSMSQSTAANRVTHDILKAPTSIEVSRIMFQVYLSGAGLGTIGSAWKKHYANV